MDSKKMTVLVTATLVLVAALLVLSVVSLTASKPTAATVTASDNMNENVITVYGQGKVSIQPDVAYITLGVVTKNQDPQIAQDENASEMENVMSALQSAGIEGKDIQTTGYNVYQRSDYVDGKEISKGYEVTNTVKVSVSDVERAGNIIKIASDAGANRFQGIQFDVIDRQTAYIDALDIALERAKEKAQKMADDIGRTVTGVVSVQESGTTSTPSSLTNFALSPNVSYDTASEASISSGELEISAVVNVIYQLN